MAAIGPMNELRRLWASGPGTAICFISSGLFADGIRPRLTKIIPCCMALMKSTTSVFSLSPENDYEFVKAPAILSFQANVSHFFAAASMKAFMPADMLPM